MDKPRFKITKILNHGTDDQIINRLFLQFYELFKTNLIYLPDEKIDEIEVILYECTVDLLKAQELMNKYLELQNKNIKEIIEGNGIKIQTNVIQYNDPSYELSKYFEDFLIRCVIVLRKTIKIAESIFNQSFEGPKELLKHLNKVFAKEEDCIKMLKEDQVWYKELYDVRGEVEHSKINISNFEALLDKNNNPLVKKQILVDKNCTVEEYMSVTLYNVFTYCEDFTIMLLKLHCSDIAVIVQIPEDQREKYRNFKYKFDLKKDLTRKIFKKECE